jgi:predicted anti-sigma-YlaC factor YlaD
MKPHFSEADLLETYYTQPGESLPVMMHLADCPECAARYERLEAKMRGLRSCHHQEKPETFWVRQRMQIMRKVADRRERRVSYARVMQFAAAAMVVLVLATLAWNQVDKSSRLRVVETTQTAAVLDDSTTRRLDDPVTASADPWESEALSDYSGMVEWESWVEDGDKSS